MNRRTYSRLHRHHNSRDIGELGSLRLLAFKGLHELIEHHQERENDHHDQLNDSLNTNGIHDTILKPCTKPGLTINL